MMDANSSRLDLAIVARGMLSSRTQAQSAILNGHITINGAVSTKPALMVLEKDSILVAETPRYVGRGGIKLEAALSEFRVDAANKQCLDVGASTGGFTDCLLQNGAAHVTAIDVGIGQMSPDLAADPKVTLRENVNARYLDETDIRGPFHLITIDVSFISLTLVLTPLMDLLASEGDLIALIKPQFEVGREHLGARGVVKSSNLREAAIVKVSRFADSIKLSRKGLMESPIHGGDGNIEYLAHFVRA